jgi:hypothetical protein
MAIDVQEAFEQSIVELGFESLLDDTEVSPEVVEEQEPSEEAEAEPTEDEEVEETEALDDDAEESNDDEQDVENETVLEVSENAKLKLPDGTVVDAKQAVLLQADYTRKTQELAEQRKQIEAKQNEFENSQAEYERAYGQMRDWYESRASRPSDWIAEIASQTQDATSTVAQALYSMAENGLLDPKFVETFGIDAGEVAEAAKGSRVQNELEELKQWRQEQELTTQRQQQVQKRALAYEQEWEQIKSSKELQFQDRISEIEAKKELLGFALQNNLTRSLTDAYDLMTVRRPDIFKKTSPPVEVSTKKASKVVTPRSSVVSNKATKKKPRNSRDAAIEALEELGL